MEIYLRKGNGCLIPDTDKDLESLKAFKTGEVIRVDPKRPRNYQFHKKFMALMAYAFDCWDQPDFENKHGPVHRSFEDFRKDITILAGYFDQVVRLDGSVRVVARSISFASMSAEDFERLYSSAIDVILKHVLTTHTREDIVDGVLAFV